jgi:cytochrome c553
MKGTVAGHSPPRAASADDQRWWRSRWLWTAVLLAMLLLLWGLSAAGQTQRGNEIVQRALMAEPDDAAGAALYKEICSACHGRQAHGNPDTVTPVLAGQLQRYLIKQFVDFAESDRSGPEMHRVAALKKLTTPQAMRNLASYLSGLPRPSTVEIGDGKQLVIGKRVYESVCAECHGTEAEGDVTFGVPALQRQHYSYLLSQARSLAVGHRYSVDISVIELLEALSFDQLTAVADYISRLPPDDPRPVSTVPRPGG